MIERLSAQEAVSRFPTEAYLTRLVCREAPTIEHIEWGKLEPGRVVMRLHLYWWAYLAMGYLHWRELRRAMRIVELYKPAGTTIDVEI